MKAGTTADGLDQMDIGYIDLASGTHKHVLDATALGVGQASKDYISNASVHETSSNTPSVYRV